VSPNTSNRRIQWFFLDSIQNMVTGRGVLAGAGTQTAGLGFGGYSGHYSKCHRRIHKPNNSS
jgi:hypothetical protein